MTFRQVLRGTMLIFGLTASNSLLALEQNDPLEQINRKIYSFNKITDSVYIKPASVAYEKVVPFPAQMAVSNFIHNVGEVPAVANGILQGKFDEAASDVFRFCINSTLGLFGIFDVASELGLNSHKQDLGKTLYAWGWKESSYFVIPILGPSTIRDTFGVVGNLYLSPQSYLKTNWRNRYYTLNMLDRRKDLHELDNITGVAGVEYYNLVRTSYFQHRDYEINGGVLPAVGTNGPNGELGEPPA